MTNTFFCPEIVTQLNARGEMMMNMMRRLMALLMAVLIALPSFAFAEDEYAIQTEEDDGIEAGSIEPEAEQELPLEDDAFLLSEEDCSFQDAESVIDDTSAVVTYWFIVDDTAIAIQEAQEGEEILRPDDPVAPEGRVFAGWFLEDGSQIFADDTSVIAHVDPLCLEINVFARFVATEADEEEESGDSENEDDDETAATEPMGEDTEIEIDLEEEGETSCQEDEIALLPEDDAVDTDQVIAEEIQSTESFEQAVIPTSSLASNDALLEAFLNREIRGSIPGRSAYSRNRMNTAANVGKEKLEQDDTLTGTVNLYNILKDRIESVAQGESRSTLFTVTAEELGINDIYWTKEDLGLTSLVDDGVLEAVLGKHGIDIEALMNALISDCPYDLYWYDKTVAISLNCQLSWRSMDGEVIDVGLAYIEIGLPVSADYASDTAFQVNEMPGRVNNAVTNINNIISGAASQSDIEKLTTYANEICGLVAYNQAAAEDSNTPYGDPWQLVFVFDGDSSTDVVCEGYAKAFKYLCDLSAFQGNVKCILVTGVMRFGTGAGEHMWNVVSMPDGRYYLVDLTNCDGGNHCTGELFLQGSSKSGDYYICGGLYYEYDPYTFATYGKSSPWLSVSAYDYGEGYQIGIAPPENGRISADKTSANAGETVTLTLTADAGYTAKEPVIKQGVNTILPTHGEDNAWSFTMPYGDVVVSAEFEYEASIVANGACGANLTWTLDSNGLLTIAGSGDITSAGWNTDALRGSIQSLVIESGVTSIACDDAFKACTQLKSVALPDTLTGIGKSAFATCTGLTEITIPDGVTSIGEQAFNNTRLTSVSIPSGVTTLSASTFANCISLASVELPNTLTTIDTGAFQYCTRLTGIEIPTSVTVIGAAAFRSCTLLESVELPEAVASIGAQAFDSCSKLTSISIPNSVTSIGAGAIPATVTVYAPCNATAVAEYASTNGIECVWIHDFNAPTYTWADDHSTATATRICKRDASHKETETVNAGSEVTKPATCEEKGETTYTATFANPAFAQQTKTVANIDALGHDWNAATYTWADDYSTVTATRTCKRDPSHPETETVNAASTVTKAATCEAKGETTYTATFTNPAFAQQTETLENIDALGHDWDAATYTWADDSSTVTATRTCNRDASHKETETVNAASAVTKAATCEEKGETTYTATFTNAVFETQTETVEDIDALGHDWNVTYTWADDYSTVTATRTCKRDATHEETETVDTTSAVTKAATCEAKGETTYTATFTNEAFAAQTKTVENIPANGHAPVTVKGKAATCTATGLTDGVKCSVCNTWITPQQTIAKLAHKPATVKGYAATCAKAGLTDGTKCSACNTWITPKKSIPATGKHSFGAWKTTKAATCTATGTQSRSCSVCNKVETQTLAKVAHKPTTVKGYAATYVKAGLSDGVKCSVCGAWITRQTAIACKVYPGSVLGKTGNNGTITVNKGEQFALTPQFATAAGLTVNGYKSSKAKVASVNGNIVTANAEGKTKITVTTNNKKKKATVTIKVVDPYKPTGISITNGKTVTLYMGQTLKLGTALKPASAKSALTWKSSKGKVAVVDGSGLVTPKAEGTTKITVTTYNKKKATITVKVVDPYKPTGISFTNGKTVTLKVGQTLKLGTALKPTNARTTLTWKSSKKGVASVDGSGLVTANKKGTAKITVTTANKKKATITIKVE